MDIKIQISDSVYRALLEEGKRIEGSIGLVNPKQGNFNAWRRRRTYEAPETRYIRLPHGRVSLTEERVNLTLRIDRRETDIVPHRAIESEATQAADFVFAHSFDC